MRVRRRVARTHITCVLTRGKHYSRMMTLATKRDKATTAALQPLNACHQPHTAKASPHRSPAPELTSCTVCQTHAEHDRLSYKIRRIQPAIPRQAIKRTTQRRDAARVFEQGSDAVPSLRGHRHERGSIVAAQRATAACGQASPSRES